VLAYLAELIGQIVEWGYGFLKLDFLFAGAIPGRRHELLAREAAYRRGIEAIRDAAGDETYLLGCGAPIVPSLGVFDAIRVGPDVAPYWENTLAHHLNVHTEPSTREAIATSIHRLWLQPLIGLDPDVVYFRSRQQMLSAAQQRLLQDLARICRCLATSDPPGWLDPDERAKLDRFLHETSMVERVARYRFRIDGREVDFSPVLAASPSDVCVLGDNR
jgi:alpha-galactosidase